MTARVLQEGLPDSLFFQIVPIAFEGGKLLSGNSALPHKTGLPVEEAADDAREEHSSNSDLLCTVKVKVTTAPAGLVFEGIDFQNIPLEGIEVDVRPYNSNQVKATMTTGPDGRASVDLPNEATCKFDLRFRTRYSERGIEIQDWAAPGSPIHEDRAEDVIPAEYPNGEVPLPFSVAHSGAGYMLSLVVKGLKRLDAHNPPYVNGVGIRWSKGAAHKTYYTPSEQLIWVGGNQLKEFNGRSINHEFGHHVMNQFGISWLPNYGDHCMTEYSNCPDPDEANPNHNWGSIHRTAESAWGEGWAGFYPGFARDTPDTDFFVSTNLENPTAAGGPADLPAGKSCVGTFRECSVAASLWAIYRHRGMTEVVKVLKEKPKTIQGFAQKWDALQTQGAVGGFDTVATDMKSWGISARGDGLAWTDATYAIDSGTEAPLNVWMNGDLSRDQHNCCQDEADSYRFQIAENQRLYIRMKPPAGENFDMELFKPWPGGSYGKRESLGDTEEVFDFNVGSQNGEWKLRVYSPNNDQEGIYDLLIDPLLPVFTSVPGVVYTNDEFEVCWHVEGYGTISHTDVHAGTSSGTYTYTSHNIQTGNAPTLEPFCDTLTAPSVEGALYVSAHASGPGSGEVGWSPERIISVQARTGEVTGLHWTRYPSTVQASGLYEYCWVPDGWGQILTAVRWSVDQDDPRWGTPRPNEWKEAGTEKCEWFEAPPSDEYHWEAATHNFVAHGQDSTGTDKWSPKLYIQIIHPYLYKQRFTDIPRVLDGPLGSDEFWRDLNWILAVGPAEAHVQWKVYGSAPISSTVLEWKLDGGVWVPGSPLYVFQQGTEGGTAFSGYVPIPVQKPMTIRAGTTGPTADYPGGTYQSIEYRFYPRPLVPLTSAIPLDDAIQLTWLPPADYAHIAQGFKVYKLSGEEYTLVAELGGHERLWTDMDVSNGQSSTYRLAVVTRLGEHPPGTPISVTPQASLNAATDFVLTSGAVGANGWHKSAVTLALLSEGPNGPPYHGIREVDVTRDGVAIGKQRYIDEFESSVGWTGSSPDPVTVPVLALEQDDVRQAFASLSATVANNPSTTSNSKPKIAKTFDLSAGGLDRVEIEVNYATTKVGQATGKLDIALFDGNLAIFSATDIVLQRGWNSVSLPATFSPGARVTRAEITLHEARKESLGSVETQTFLFDALRLSDAPTIQESESGPHLWGTQITDGRGVLQDTGHRTFKIDTVAPSTSATPDRSPATTGWYNAPVEVALSPSDTVSGVSQTTYRVGSGAYQTYSEPFTVSGEGLRTVSYYSTDVAGNSENVRHLDISIDTTSPTTTFSLAGTGNGNEWYSGPVTVTISPADSGSKPAATFYRVDEGPWILIPQTGSGKSGATVVSGAGTHAVEAYTMDKAGNTQITVARSFQIDDSPPVVRTRTPAPGATTIPSAEIIATHDDLGGSPSSGIDATRNVVQVLYSATGLPPWSDVSGQGATTATAAETKWKSQQLGGMPPGTYRVTGTIYDVAGNSVALQGPGWTFTVAPA